MIKINVITSIIIVIIPNTSASIPATLVKLIMLSASGGRWAINDAFNWTLYIPYILIYISINEIIYSVILL